MTLLPAKLNSRNAESAALVCVQVTTRIVLTIFDTATVTPETNESPAPAPAAPVLPPLPALPAAPAVPPAPVVPPRPAAPVALPPVPVAPPLVDPPLPTLPPVPVAPLPPVAPVAVPPVPVAPLPLAPPVPVPAAPPLPGEPPLSFGRQPASTNSATRPVTKPIRCATVIAVRAFLMARCLRRKGWRRASGTRTRSRRRCSASTPGCRWHRAVPSDPPSTS